MTMNTPVKTPKRRAVAELSANTGKKANQSPSAPTALTLKDPGLEILRGLSKDLRRAQDTKVTFSESVEDSKLPAQNPTQAQDDTGETIFSLSQDEGDTCYYEEEHDNSEDEESEEDSVNDKSMEVEVSEATPNASGNPNQTNIAEEEDP